ncbi:band 4.1-like protein 4 [Trichonephila clavipes]|nr:band 4.1-like protein 4 [Trichonephila clavipes]
MRLIRQTWLLPITTYLHHWDTHWLTRASLLTKMSNLGLMTGWPQKTDNFFGVGEDHIEYFLGLTPSGVLVIKGKNILNHYFWPRMSKVFFKGKSFMIRIKDKTVKWLSPFLFISLW